MRNDVKLIYVQNVETPFKPAIQIQRCMGVLNGFKRYLDEELKGEYRAYSGRLDRILSIHKSNREIARHLELIDSWMMQEGIQVANPVVATAEYSDPSQITISNEHTSLLDTLMMGNNMSPFNNQ